MSREKTSLHDAPNDEPSFVVESELNEKENLIASEEKKSASGGEEIQTDDEKIQDESLSNENRNDEKDEKKEVADLESGDSDQEKKTKIGVNKKSGVNCIRISCRYWCRCCRHASLEK